ncbi:hypothetical protein [Phaffia rhodozyma]|uniref:Immunoreactive mannoprotein MP88 n=1 Tax=Phaffia rhodozyma TaxID=264483 RepID=A0A0F7SI60_PHARH|nr:hypothetical protein [Phaffia rhodozyma]
MSAALLLPLLALAPAAYAQVTATGTQGVTNPATATLGVYNQTSYSRLLSVNSVDDFCIFSPPVAGDTIGDTEEEEVAWCTKPRNNARVIPDGTITAAHFVKTPLYVQITGFGDLTKLNVLSGDEGGELDPHGSTGLGNPVGGNVTSDVSGADVPYQEWMNYVAYNSFCIRICTAENSTYSAAVMCEHTFDLMGCEWVMPGDYDQEGFTSCDGDSAYPPGVYPVGSAGSGTTSTFAQRYTGTYSDSYTTDTWTIGYTVTPQTPYMTPASSNCFTYSTISNGIASLTAGTVSVATSAATVSSGAVAAVSSAAASSSGSASQAAITSSAAAGSSSMKTSAAAKSSATAVASAAASKATSAASAASAAATSVAASNAFRSSAADFTLWGSIMTLGAVVLGAGTVMI